VSTVSSITDINKQVVIYPNPTNGTVQIGGVNDVLDVKCFDVSGRELDVERKGNTIQFAELPAGLYFLQIETSAGVATKRISKQ